MTRMQREQNLYKMGSLRVLGKGFRLLRRSFFSGLVGKSYQTFENIQKRSKTV